MSFEFMDHPKDDDASGEGPSRKSFKSNPAAIGNLQELLECPVCLNAMYPPIFQCYNGHTLCSGCKTHVRNRCPTCRCEMGSIRCLALEKISASVALPCRYLRYGCPGVYPYMCKVEHESRCAFRPYDCPCAGYECAVVGNVPSLINHLRDDHLVSAHLGSSFNHRYVKANPHDHGDSAWTLTVFSCFRRFFCLHFEEFLLGTSSPAFIAFLRFMGDGEDARNYGYCLEVAGNGRRLTWHGVPRSIRDGRREVMENHDGLIIPQNLAFFLFGGGDRNELQIPLTGRIWKKQD